MFTATCRLSALSSQYTGNHSVSAYEETELDKRPNKDRNKKEIFVIGRKPNLQLWNELEAKARGSKDHQIEAVEALVLRIRELPEDADELLVSLSKSASLPVKRRLTTALA